MSPISYSFLVVSVTLILQICLCSAANPVQVSIPASPSLNNVVSSNFLGVSFELSFMDEYFGNDSSSTPQTMINYLSQIRTRNGANAPVRLRIGGNSADSSVYVPEQTSPMVQLTDPTANANNQPVNYGPELWNVMKKVSDGVEGVEYLIGLTLNDPKKNDAVIAGAAKKVLGDSLDAMLLGNEPDLYTAHNQRPNLANYTVQDYIGEYSVASSELNDTSAGDLLSASSLAGPTICCAWDLATLLQQGYLSTFSKVLKYITLQHYPQNNCFGTHPYELPYYIQHANAVTLAAWQQPGIDIVQSNTSPGSPRLVMSEFNSASCGGLPGISDTFAVGSLWTIDYSLQMASVGYSAAYIHTRERGISYNLVTPPPLSGNLSDAWTTNPPFYPLIVLPEILSTNNGGVVVDLDVGGSKKDVNSLVAGYAVYDAHNSTVTRLALFNFGNSSIQFSLPKFVASSSVKTPYVKYLSAVSRTEQQKISWGGQSFQGVGDGKLVDAAQGSAWAAPNQDLDCSDGCTVDAPALSLAVVFLDNFHVQDATSSSTSNGSNGTSAGNGKSNGAGSQYAQSLSLLAASGVLAFFVL